MRQAALWITTVLTAVLSACGGDTALNLQTGQFVDDPVSGLSYSCTNGTQTNSGITNDLGQFSYQPGQTCTFKVGKVTLGTLSNIPSDGKVTPQDVAGVTRSATTAPSALAIAQFLQSLNDGSASGKIVIPVAMQTLMDSAAPVTLVSSTGTISSADLQNLVVNVAGKTLVNATAATAALDAQLVSNVSASAGAVSASARVLNSIVVSSAASSKAAGLTTQLSARGYYSDGTNTDITNTVTWASSDTSKLTLNSAGLATTLVKGSATVTASLQPSGAIAAVSGTFVQTITDPVLQSISVTHVASPPAGRTDQLTATGNYSDGSTADLTSVATWSSSDTSKVTLSTSTQGLATGVAEGSATVTASYTPAGSNTAITGTISESVLAPTVTNLVISYIQAGLSSIQQGATAALKAVATLSNSTTQTVSSLVNWVVASVGGGSGAGTVAKNANDGTANATLTGSAAGDVSISASYQGNTSNSLSLTVTPLLGVSGTVAQGAAVAEATVTGTCQGGTATGTSASDGNYTLTMPAGTTGPCLLKAETTDNAGNPVTYYSVSAPAVGVTTAVANITPITHLMASNVLGKDPATASIASDASVLTPTAITNAATVVSTSLTGLGISLPAATNPITGQFTAAPPDSGVSSDPLDKALDTLMHSIAVGSTKLADLATSFRTTALSANVTQVANTIKTALSTLASTNKIPTSSSATCPAAVSGPYVTARVGNTNLQNGNPKFGVVAFNFSATTSMTVGQYTVPASSVMLGNGTSYSFTSEPSKPCDFNMTVSQGVQVKVSVSPAGFIVASNLFSTTATTVGAGNVNPETNWGTLGKTDLVLGVPFQPGIALDDVKGTWQTQEWDQVLGSLGGKYVNWHRRFTLTTGAPNALSVAACHIDGISQSTNSGSCIAENAGADITVQQCAFRQDCPVFGVSLQLTNVFDVVMSGNVIMKVAGFKAPNGDLIALQVGNVEANDSTYFQETFGIILRSAGTAPLPATGKVVNNPQWKLFYPSGSNNPEKIQAQDESYTVTVVTPKAANTPANITRVYASGAASAGASDVVYLDKPYVGMVFRPYVADSNGKQFSEMSAIRGNGWAISGGTATLANQLQESFPTGQGRFFSVNLKY